MKPSAQQGFTPGDRAAQLAASTERHAGEIAFPGGRADPGDPSPTATALRELGATTGLDFSVSEHHGGWLVLDR